MKRRAVLMGLLGLISLPYIWAADVQFYQANRAARLVVALKSKARYPAKDPVPVTVMLTNQSQEPILINKRMRFNQYPLDGEIAFVIRGPGGKAYPLATVISPQDFNENDLAVLHVGETMEQEAGLAKLYGMTKKGTYRVQAIYYNHLVREKNGKQTWRGTIASEPTEITLY